ncbi:MAG TPA: type VI secretion system tube protein Hcp [Bryobacteraceae bacterium]|nr:type VI secretion system tube protein Hcp [Bryobacteraceae bacterium]
MAKVDYFLKIDGIKGESLDSKHKDEIQIQSYSWGEQNSGTFSDTSGGGAGKVQMHDFTFTQVVQKSSPLLVKACATGQHIKNAILTCRKAGTTPQEYLKITMSDILVSSYSVGGQAEASVVPTDAITLNFAKIEYSYAPQKADGSLDGFITATYDLKQSVST